MSNIQTILFQSLICAINSFRNCMIINISTKTLYIQYEKKKYKIPLPKVYKMGWKDPPTWKGPILCWFGNQQ